MPQIKTLTFDPALHQYKDEDQNLYISATQKLGLITPVFDEDYWAAKKAKERGITAEEVKAEWAAIRGYANKKGNIVHGLNEDSVNESAIGFKKYIEHKTAVGATKSNPIWGFEIDMDIFARSPLAVKYPKIFLAIKHWIDKGWKLYSEKRVYLYEYLIAGTIDLLLVKGNQFIIIDWKTNKDHLKFNSGYYKKANGIKTNIWVDKKEYMKYPLAHREHCKGTIYTLQLSLYAAMAEAWGFVCIGLLLFHIMETTIEDAEKIEVSNAPIYPYKIEYWKDDAWKLIKYNVANHKEQLLIPRQMDQRRSFGIRSHAQSK